MPRTTIRTTLMVLLAVVGLLVTVLAIPNAWGSGGYLLYLVTRGDVFDIWALLSLLSFMLAVAAIAGFWLSWRGRRRGLAAAFLLLPLPAPFLLEANRCDVYPFCEATDWARLPPAAFDWRIRYRDVDSEAAKGFAQGALLDAKLPYHAWDPKLIGGEWQVETRDDDMNPGPYTVVVDARTEKTRIVPIGSPAR